MVKSKLERQRQRESQVALENMLDWDRLEHITGDLVIVELDDHK